MNSIQYYKDGLKVGDKNVTRGYLKNTLLWGNPPQAFDAVVAVEEDSSIIITEDDEPLLLETPHYV